MSTAEALTTIVSLSVFMLTTVLALIWYIGGNLSRLGDRLDGRIDHLEQTVGRLVEDVAVLRATR